MPSSASTPSFSNGTEIVIDCPVPPSLNRLWRVGKGRVYKNPQYNRWFREFWFRWLVSKPKGFATIKGQFDAIILVAPERKRDADNTAKGLLDACQKLEIVANDSQARRVTQELVDKRLAPSGCRLRIIPLGQPTP